MHLEHPDGLLLRPALSATAAADDCTGHLAEIAMALECALRAVPQSDPDAERQFRKLLWLLCRRSGGGICRRPEIADSACDDAMGCRIAVVGLSVGAD